MPDDIATEVDAVVVGAGFGGLYALHLLREKGFSARAFEAAGGVGGTWYWNRYPGARCDVESVDYCYSFSEEIHQEWNWSERFATQPEILRYAEFVADHLDLRRHITFGVQVTSVEWDGAALAWRVGTDDGRTVRARFVITAVGLLSASNTPTLPGLADFAGRVLHTGHWPHEGVDFSGRTVVVIGTGSSGVQVIPEIARQARHTTVLQRTANFSVPARNRLLSGREIRRAKEDLPFIREQAAVSNAGFYSPTLNRSVFDFTPEQRQAELDRRWAVGGLDVLTTYNDTSTSREANDAVAEFVRGKIREIVADPDTAEKLQPRTHPIGSKRPTVNTDYYETFNRPDVALVDLASEPIVEVTEHGLRTEKGEYAADDIVFATGYDAVSGPLVRMGIRGRDGRSLAEEWAGGPRTFLGLAVAGFPNLFTITGPLSAAPLTNVMRSIEHHVDWIGDCLEHLRDHGFATIEVRPEAQEEWDRRIAEVGARTFYPSVASWYTGGNIAGKTLKLMAWVGGLAAYRQICQQVADDGYRDFLLGSAPARPAVALAESMP